ncbi:MAG: zf-HC2 domain-containing protein [Caldisericia bacterium]
MKDCKDIRHLLLDYLEGSLSPEREEMVRSHLYDCEDCRKYFETLSITAKNTEEILSNYAKTATPPPYLWGNILREVQKSKRKVAVSWWKVAVATCAVVGVLMTGTFAPVFGAEGNLLNVISGSIIGNASDDLSEIISDDLLGSLRKEEIISHIVDNSDLTEDLIWELEEKGYTEKDIVQCAQIADSGTWPIEKVIEKRDKGFGFGRIANWAGVSVFSVQNRVAKPIRTLRDDIKGRQEFQINTTIAGFDEEQRIISPHLPEPIGLPPEILDGDGMRIPQGEIEDSFVAMVFRFEDGKPTAKQIIKQEARPPKLFNIRGEIESIENGVINLKLLNGETVSATLVIGRTNIFGEIEVGSDIKIFGFKSEEGKMFVDYIKSVHGNMEHLPPKVPYERPRHGMIPPPPPPPPSEDINPEIRKPVAETNPSENNTEIPENTVEKKNEEKTDVNVPADNDKINTTDTKSDVEKFTGKAVTLSSTNGNTINTNSGTFDISNAKVGIVFKGGVYPVNREVLASTKAIKEISISGEGDAVNNILITDKSLSKTECLVLEKNPEATNFKLFFGDGESKIIKSNSTTIFLQNTKQSIKNQKINLYRFADITDLAIAIEVVPDSQKIIEGIVEGIDDQGVIVKGVKYEINPGVTEIFRTTPQNESMRINPSEICPSSEIRLVYSSINDEPVAIRINLLKKGQGENQPNRKSFKIHGFDYNREDGIITLSISKGNNGGGGNNQSSRRITVTSQTAIILKQPNEQLRSISLKQMANLKLVGMDVSFEEQNGKITKITIIDFPPPSPF